MKCLSKLISPISPKILKILAAECTMRGIRGECEECPFYPEDDTVDGACELIKNSKRIRKITIPTRWDIPENTGDCDPAPAHVLNPEEILKKIRVILDKCNKSNYDRSTYISEEECKNCPLFHISCKNKPI